MSSIIDSPCALSPPGGRLTTAGRCIRTSRRLGFSLYLQSFPPSPRSRPMSTTLKYNNTHTMAPLQFVTQFIHVLNLYPHTYHHERPIPIGSKFHYHAILISFHINITRNKVSKLEFQKLQWLFSPTTSKSVKHYKHCQAAWRIFIPARRFKLAEATTTHKLMNRLAAHASPPGDFWAEPRKRNKTIHSRQNPYSYDPTRYIMMNVIKGTRKQLPLPGIPC